MDRMRLIAGSACLLSVCGLAVVPAGCSLGSRLGTPHLNRVFTPRAVADNPLLIPNADQEVVWNKTVAVVDRYFDIASENRLARTIVTQPKIGATLLEPWSGDSVGFQERLESTLQTIRRFAIVKIEPAPTGGHLVKVEVRKELEDLVKPDRAAAGRAVFNNDFPVNRSREIVGPVPAPAGWIPRGRDPILEQAILARIRDEFFL